MCYSCRETRCYDIEVYRADLKRWTIVQRAWTDSNAALDSLACYLKTGARARVVRDDLFLAGHKSKGGVK